jgi:CRP-like cAMP-binding protein
MPAFAKQLQDILVPAGRVLMRQGTPGAEAFLVADGEAAVTVSGLTVGKVGKGDLVGEMALLDHSPRSATVTADSPMRLLVLHPQAFAALVRQPTLSWWLATMMAQRLRLAQAPSC